MKTLLLITLLAVAGNAAAYCDSYYDLDDINGEDNYQACLDAERRARDAENRQYEAERRAEEAEERAEEAEREAAYNQWYYDE